MKIIKTILGLIVVSVILLISSCSHDDKIPLDTIDLEINIKRFDQDLFSINIDSVDTELNSLENKYDKFLPIFSQGVIGIGLPEDPNFEDYISSFISDNMVSEANDYVQRIFPNTDELDSELTKAFKRYKYYFPEKQIPEVYGFVSGFNNSIIIADSILGIGFDRYLGRDNKFYPLLGIHKYIQYNMYPDKIPSDAVKSWVLGEFLFNDSIDNLVNNMIYEGMLMYLTKKLLPNQPDSIIFGFTPEQVKWCKRNESQMWGYLVEHKMLFNSDSFTIDQFIGGAPFTHGFTNDSPGKAAVWLGYRIVVRFMERNKEYTLSNLMNETDYQSILNRARYNP
jgi:hypothetical protein